MQITRVVAAASAIAVVGVAEAKSVLIDGLGGGISLRAGNISGIAFGGESDPRFTVPTLAAVNSAVKADGVTTAGMVSILLAQTDVGLSLMALVDDQQEGALFQSFDSSLGFTSTVSRSDVSGPDQWINDVVTATPDIQVAVDIPGNLQFAGGSFDWDAASGMGDGFAWSGLQAGDFISMGFTEFADLSFQFLSWDGSSWGVVETADFSSGGQFAFSARVIPLPMGAGLGLLGLVGVAGARRRMVV